MENVVLETGESPEVIVTALGDLRVTGWDRAELSAEVDGEHDVAATQAGERVTLKCTSDCTLYIPRQARLTVEECQGDVRIKSLDSLAEIKCVYGDLTLRKTGAANIGEVKSDLSVKKAEGDVTVQHVYGDVAVRDVHGQFRAERVAGDLYLRDVSAGAQAEASGDIIVSLDFAPEYEYGFRAGGDLLCRVPADSNATFTLTCVSGDINVDVPDAESHGNGRQRTVRLGDGTARVTLEAKGDISLVNLAADWETMGDFGEHFGQEFGVMAEEFAQQIESQIEAQMEVLERQLNEQLGNLGASLGSTGGVDAEAIARRAKAAAERAAKHATQQAERAKRHAERQVEHARRRAEAAVRRKARAQARISMSDRSRPWRVEWDSTHTARSGDPVSDEERLAILRMVEQKKISVDEAEKLLASLEGRS